jgi:hypothetical protein
MSEWDELFDDVEATLVAERLEESSAAEVVLLTFSDAAS